MYLSLILKATKNERCSLAAKIIYSNLHTNSTRQAPFSATTPASSSTSATKNNTNRPLIDRIKRPSTLAKPSSSSNQQSPCSANESQQTKSQVHSEHNNESATNMSNFTRPKAQFVQKTTDSDDSFPPPPPIPQQLQLKNASKISHRSNLVLKDYEEPINSRSQHQPAATVNVNVKLYPQPHVNNTTNNNTSANGNLSKFHNSTQYFNVEEDFKKKVFYKLTFN